MNKEELYLIKEDGPFQKDKHNETSYYVFSTTCFHLEQCIKYFHDSIAIMQLQTIYSIVSLDSVSPEIEYTKVPYGNSTSQIIGLPLSVVVKQLAEINRLQQLLLFSLL